MSAKQFIDKLEKLALLSPDILEELRRQVQDSKARITAGTLARLLVDNGHLTKFQATKLISDMSKDAPDRRTAEAKQSSDDDLLDLAPEAPVVNKAVILDDDDNDDGGSEVEVVAVPAEDDEVVAVEVVDDDEVVAVEVVGDDDEVVAVEVVDEAADSAEASAAVESRPKRSSKRITKIESSGTKRPKEVSSKKKPRRPLNPPSRPGDNPWESHRILSVGVVLGLLLVFAGALAYYFFRGNAEQLLADANDAYKPNNYEVALKKYESFVSKFSTHEEASMARVRVGMCKIRKDIESLPNPIEALKTAEAVLPTLVKEPGLASERGDVAGALVALAQKFNARADNAKDTAGKKQLMGEMKRLDALLADTQYVGNSARDQFGVALKSIEEDTRRIERDIAREEDLATSLVQIDEKLKENRTSEAYLVRSNLLSRFPQLERDPSIIQRVQEAARIQQTLVTPDIPEIKVSPTAPPAPSTKAVTLVNRAGSDAAALAGRVICVAVKGTVYGLDGQTGNVKWRYFVGRDMVDDPVAVNDSRDSDVIVLRPEVGHLTRLEGATGKVKWFCELGGPALAPRIDGDDMLVSLKSGTLLNIEPQTGQIKWAAHTPQPLQVTPIINGEKEHVYVPANHQNMYVLSRQDGRCKEVFYVGHREGGIAVPPIHLLGQLFIFENRTTEKCVVRILKTGDNGANITADQEPVEMDGNIVTMPLVDRRKLVVITDRGQIKVFDIEPSAEKNRVSVLASEVGGESRPMTTWGVTEDDRLWMTNFRFTRWDVQVSTGKLVRPWILDDGDEFVGPPLKFDDTIVHRRIPRGNRGVRVTAAKADSGAVQWAVDLGVPVVMLASPAQGRFDAVIASGAQFAIDPSQLLINRAEFNVDSFKPGMNYSNPRTLANGFTSMQNLTTANRFMTYAANPSGPKIKNAGASFAAKATTAPGAVGNGLAVGLDNGQLMVIDPLTGTTLAKPFQPPVEPGKKHVWNEPVYLDEAKALFATDSRRKLYRLGVGESLRALSDVDLDGTPMGPAALIGKQVAIVVSTQTSESLLAFDSATLAKAGTTLLDGRWQAGPFRISPDLVLVQTDRKLQAFGEGGKKAWELAFPKVRLAAPPALQPNGIAIAATNGQVWLIDTSNGSVQLERSVDQPLSAAPLVIAGGMLLGTDEGSVLLLPKSETPVSTKGPQ